MLPVHIEEHLLRNLVSGSKKSIWTELLPLDVQTRYIRRRRGNELDDRRIGPTAQELSLFVGV